VAHLNPGEMFFFGILKRRRGERIDAGKMMERKL